MQKLMQATFAFIFALILSLISASFAYADDILPGSGTEADPYRISTADQLVYFAQLVNGEPESDSATPQPSLCATLVADIDLNPGFTFNEDGSYTGAGEPILWMPMGSAESRYSGTFDGDGYTISGLYSESDYAGLFGVIGDSGVVCNVSLDNGYLHGGESAYSSYAGSIAAYNMGTIRGCTSSLSVLGGAWAAGGIAGGCQGVIDECRNEGTVDGYSLTGGIVGYSTTTTISNCVNVGLVTARGQDLSGGIAGFCEVQSAVKNCCNAGTVGKPEFGGLVGVIGDTNTITGSLYVGAPTEHPLFARIAEELEGSNNYYLNDTHSAWIDESGNEVSFDLVKQGVPSAQSWVKTVTFQIDDTVAATIYAFEGTPVASYVPDSSEFADVLPEGYELAGWTAEEGSSTLFDFSAPVSENIVLHAVLNDARPDEPSDDEEQTTEDAVPSDDGADISSSADLSASSEEPLPQTGDTPLLYVLSAMCLLSVIACVGSRLLSRKYSQ